MTDATSTAVLLVAGMGSRLRPLTDEVPKALIHVNGCSMLERAVTALCSKGVRRFVFATGYREEAVRSAVEAMGIDAAFCHNPRYDVTQNSISLLYCRHELEGRGFYKLDGDVLFDGEIIDRLARGAEPLVVATDGVRALDTEAMKVVISQDRRIARFGKAIPVVEAHGESIGIERIDSTISKDLFNAIATFDRVGIVDRYYEDIYSELIDAKTIAACAVEVGDLRWSEVDNQDDLARASAQFA